MRKKKNKYKLRPENSSGDDYWEDGGVDGVILKWTDILVL
jgi:hypothetical protein